MKIVPTEQFGRIRGRGPALEILFDYAQRTLDNFKKTEPPSFELVEKRMRKLLDDFKREIPVEEEMDLFVEEDLNATVEIEQEEELELALDEEQEIELNEELLLELEMYNYHVNPDSYEEIPWQLELDKPLATQLEGKQGIYTVPRILGRTYRKKVSTKEYASCFPDNLLMTENFYRTCAEELPVFHRYNKNPGFILVVEAEEKHQFLLISEKEAAYFKQILDKNQKLAAYLVDLHGRPEISGDFFEKRMKESETMAQSLMTGLWYANLFSGRMDFIEENQKLSYKLIESHQAIMAKFLQLKLANNHVGLRQLYESSLFEFSEKSAAE